MFWIICLILISVVALFFIPWLAEVGTQFAAFSFMVCFSFGIYVLTGGLPRQQHIAQHHHDKGWETKRLELRHMLNALKKQEFKLRQQLSENPQDGEAEYRLLDLMAIKALQQGKAEVAKALWHKALLLMPIHKDTQNMRERIEYSLKNL